MQQPTDAVTHLGSLAAALRRRGLDACVITTSTPPHVKATNPNTPELNERVLCCPTEDDSLSIWWLWRQPIDSADDLETVASKIAAVLRSVEDPS